MFESLTPRAREGRGHLVGMAVESAGAPMSALWHLEWRGWLGRNLELSGFWTSLVVVVLVVVVVLTVPIAAVSWYLLVAPRAGSAQPRRAGWGFR